MIELKNITKIFGNSEQPFSALHNINLKNILLPLQYTKIAKKEQEKRVDHLLERLYIQDKKNCYPSELSGGQKQRVAIARALVNDAEVILCDEPTGALDSKTTKEIMKIFMELHESGKTLIIVTHDEKVVSYCEKIIYLEDGNIVNKK